MITLLDPAGYRRTPWKNGGGVTVDIAEHKDAWRFGRTPIPVVYSGVPLDQRYFNKRGNYLVKS